MGSTLWWRVLALAMLGAALGPALAHNAREERSMGLGAGRGAGPGAGSGAGRGAGPGVGVRAAREARAGEGFWLGARYGRSPLAPAHGLARSDRVRRLEGESQDESDRFYMGSRYGKRGARAPAMCPCSDLHRRDFGSAA